MLPLLAPERPRSAIQAAACWRYVDRLRTHTVDAEWRKDARALRIVETAAAASDARVAQTVPIAQSWEARVAIWILESRLAQLGEYWRSAPGSAGWARVMRPPGAPSADLRPNHVLGGSALVHHYHDERGGGDTLVAAHRAAHDARYVVLRAHVDVASLAIGRIDLLDPRLPETLARSVLMREQIALSQSGMEKLVSRDDYVRAFGDAGGRRASRLVDEIMERVRQGQLERPVPRAEAADAFAEFLVTLRDPRLLALHHRFLSPGDEEQLLASGPIRIRRSISAIRCHTEHTQQHLLTILEASLLARERLQSGSLRQGDPEVRALTRLAYYL